MLKGSIPRCKSGPGRDTKRRMRATSDEARPSWQPRIGLASYAGAVWAMVLIAEINSELAGTLGRKVGSLALQGEV